MSNTRSPAVVQATQVKQMGGGSKDTAFRDLFVEAITDVVEANKDLIIAKAIEGSQINVKTIPTIKDGKPGKKIVHGAFQLVLGFAQLRHPLFLYGEAGTGKTTIAKDVAEALKLDFYTISVNEQSSKSDFLGYYDAHSNLIKTNFRKAYENGGVYVIDEIDAGNPNVLTVLNSALSNGTCAFPDGNVSMHKDFICICTANTYGDDVDVKYIGRNILDAATLDRFLRVYVGYDLNLEKLILSQEVFDFGQKARAKNNADKLNKIISTRSLIQLNDILKMDNIPLKEAIPFVFAFGESQEIFEHLCK